MEIAKKVKQFCKSELKREMCVLSHSVISDCLRPPWPVASWAPMQNRILHAKNTGIGVPLHTPGILPDPGLETTCILHLLHWEAVSLPLAPPETPKEIYRL